LTEKEKLVELMCLHDEALEHLLKFDGHCKSSEGSVSVHYTNSWDRRAGEWCLKVKGVEVYAYVVGPSRTHWFDSVDEALKEVRKWHAEAMAYEGDENW